MNTVNGIWVVIWVLGFFMMSGCSTLSSSEIDDVTIGTSNIDVVKSRVLSIYNVRVKEEDGNTIISGKIRTSRVQRYISGHIDIDIQNTSGKTLHNLSTEISHKSIHRHHLTHFPRFRVVVMDSLPSDARIRVKYHSNREGKSYSSECKNVHCSQALDSKLHNLDR